MTRRRFDPAASALLDKLLAEKAAEEAKEKPPSQAELNRELDWLESYARGKPIKHFGGNYYGINRNRCSIIKPVMIASILKSGRAVGNTASFTIPVTKKLPKRQRDED